MADGVADGLPLVANRLSICGRQAIHDDNVAERELRRENLGHIGDEGITVDGCHRAPWTPSCQYCAGRRRRSPCYVCGVAFGSGGHGERWPEAARPAGSSHAGADPGFVGEHQSVGFKL